MGEIYLEDLGIIEIEGDAPNETETRAILDATGQLPAEATFTGSPPPPPKKGPLGLISRAFRGKVREEVEEMPGLLEFLTEMSPAAVGTGLGAGIGALGGNPLTIFLGGTLGGLAGELIGQETGVAERSNLNLGLAAGGPAIGRGVGAVVRTAGKLTGGGITHFPPMKAARARMAATEATERMSSLGADILAKAKGLMARPADHLYKAARRAGAVLTGEDFAATKNAMQALKAEIEPISAFTEPAQAIRVLDDVEKMLLSGDVDFNKVIAAKRAIGVAIRGAQKAGGIQLGSARKVFAALSDDLDRFAAGARSGLGARSARGARLVQAAAARAKLEFAVRDLEGMIAKSTKAVPGENAVRIDFTALQQSLLDVTNPKHPRFDKNFTTALGDELAVIRDHISSLAKITETMNPGGPASLVLRGQFTKLGRRLVGGMLVGGAATGEPTGALLGGMVFAGGPEILTAMLMNKPAMRFLERAARLGRGEVSRKAWMIAGQIAAQATKEPEWPEYQPERP